MLKRLLSAISLLLLCATPLAIGQDASQIQLVQDGKSCSGCNLFQADLAYRDMNGIDVSKSRLRQANLSLATMDRSNFSGANLSVANLFGGRFTSANFEKVDFTSATLVGAYFGSARFSGAVLTGANLAGADMETAIGLTQAQLDTACGDQSTKLPQGLTLPNCVK